MPDGVSTRGDIPKQVMTDVGITQSEVSRISGGHRPSMSQFLSGRPTSPSEGRRQHRVEDGVRHLRVGHVAVSGDERVGP